MRKIFTLMAVTLTLFLCTGIHLSPSALAVEPVQIGVIQDLTGPPPPGGPPQARDQVGFYRPA